MAKTIAKKNTGAHAFRKPCGSRPSRPARWPSWKMSRATPNAAPTASRLVTTPTAARMGACSATSSSRNPSARTTPMTSGVLALSAASRSWFSATEPPTSAPSGRSLRRRSMVAPTALSDGSCLGTTWTITLPARPGMAGMTWATPASALAVAATCAASAFGRDDLQRAGRALAEGVLHLGVGGARAVALGHDLDRRHAGLQPEHGDAQRDEDRDGHGAVGDRPAPQALGPGGEAAASGARPSAPTAARACPRAGRAWRARPAAG